MEAGDWLLPAAPGRHQPKEKDLGKPRDSSTVDADATLLNSNMGTKKLGID